MITDKGGKIKMHSFERQTYTVREIAKIIGINCTAAYDLVRQSDFPARRIGRRIVVSKSGLDLWLEFRALDNPKK